MNNSINLKAKSNKFKVTLMMKSTLLKIKKSQIIPCLIINIRIL